MDYMGIPSDLVFNDGDTMRCLNLTIIDDTIAEFCEETLIYSFSTTSIRVALPSAQDLVIMDNGKKISTTASFVIVFIFCQISTLVLWMILLISLMSLIGSGLLLTLLDV